MHILPAPLSNRFPALLGRGGRHMISHLLYRVRSAERCLTSLIEIWTQCWFLSSIIAANLDDLVGIVNAP